MPRVNVTCLKSLFFASLIFCTDRIPSRSSSHKVVNQFSLYWTLQLQEKLTFYWQSNKGFNQALIKLSVIDWQFALTFQTDIRMHHVFSFRISPDWSWSLTCKWSPCSWRSRRSSSSPGSSCLPTSLTWPTSARGWGRPGPGYGDTESRDTASWQSLGEELRVAGHTFLSLLWLAPISLWRGCTCSDVTRPKANIKLRPAAVAKLGKLHTFVIITRQERSSCQRETETISGILHHSFTSEPNCLLSASHPAATDRFSQRTLRRQDRSAS